MNEEGGGRSLRSNFFWTLAGYVSMTLGMTLTVIAITRLTSAGTLGEYAFAMAVIGPIYTLSLLHLSTLQVTDRNYVFGDFLALRVWMTAFASAAALLLAWQYGGGGVRAMAIVAIAVGLVARNLTDVYLGACRRAERLDIVGRVSVLHAALGLVAMVSVLWMTEDLVAALTAEAAASWAVLFVFAWPASREVLGPSLLRPNWNGYRALAIAVRALPIALVMLLVDLHVAIPRIVVDALLGTTYLGIFVAVAAVAGVGGTLARAGSDAVLPRFASLDRAGDYGGMRELLDGLCRISGMIAAGWFVVAFLAGGLILGIVYGDEHAKYGTLLVLFTLATGVTYILSLHASALTAMRRFKEQAVLRAVQLAVLVGALVVFVPKAGLLGAAGALLLAESLGLAMHRALVLRYVRD